MVLIRDLEGKDDKRMHEALDRLLGQLGLELDAVHRLRVLLVDLIEDSVNQLYQLQGGNLALELW